MSEKAEAQKLLFEKFGIRDTTDFRILLNLREFEKAAEVVEFVENNPDRFPQYGQKWLHDRRSEIRVARARREGRADEIVPKREYVEAAMELGKLFGFADTDGFREALARGDIERAEKWLRHIKSDPGNFPQYIATWDDWLADRERELRKAKTAL
jgi:hypothetical protein